jgi:hypothetical protein
MVLCMILSLLSDFAVSGLVQTVNVGGRCPFGTGLVIPSTFSSDGWWSVPPYNGAPAFVAANAQVTSASNDGLVGVYWKVNRDPSFRADSQDVAGSWSCTDEGTVTFPPGTSPTSIVQDLYQGGYLYRLETNICMTEFANGTFSHFLILDSSTGNRTGSTFEIKASIELTWAADGPTTMNNYDCKMNGTAISWVLENMISQETLRIWCLRLQGYVYDGTRTNATNNPGAILEQYLNSIIMVAGGKDYLLSIPTNESAGSTQGCQVQKTFVPVEVLVMLSLVTAGLVSSGVTLFVLHMWERIDHVDQKLSQTVPNDLVSWMSQAVQEHRGGRNITPRELKTWAFGRRPTGMVGIIFVGQPRRRRQRQMVPDDEIQLTGFGSYE